MPDATNEEETLKSADRAVHVVACDTEEPVSAIPTNAQVSAQRVIALHERFAAVHKAYPLPAPTRKIADKSFFDDR